MAQRSDLCSVDAVTETWVSEQLVDDEADVFRLIARIRNIGAFDLGEGRARGQRERRRRHDISSANQTLDDICRVIGAPECPMTIDHKRPGPTLRER
jgi:hypothetical protein